MTGRMEWTDERMDDGTDGWKDFLAIFSYCPSVFIVGTIVGTSLPLLYVICVKILLTIFQFQDISRSCVTC
jgi:hypothetical protein